MKVEQIYTGCLAQGAYYIESNGEAAIIDPLRETEPYIGRARADQAQIKYIFETHFHADFVSGHLDLARKTGAQIIYGPGAETTFDKYEAKDGEEFKLGAVRIRVLHTPGHTPESACYLLIDEGGKPYAVFSGDTLFIGDIGRPDLAQKATGLTQEDLAGWLYDSLRSKIMTLPDDVIVYPAHGAGSACGKNMSDETSSTIGEQKMSNYALRADMTRDEFIREVTDGLLPPPQYFALNAKLNKTGYDSIDEVMKRGVQPLSPREFETVANATGAIVLDVRDKEAFVQEHIPNSIFIGLDGTFAPWVGALIPDLKQELLVVAPEGRERETIMRLARVGYDNALGYLDGGMEAWKMAGLEVDRVETIDVSSLAQRFREGQELQILDVRRPGEWQAGHVATAESFPLDYMNQKMHEVDKRKTYYLHCRTGYRSTIAASILKARGYHQVVDVLGTFDEMRTSGLPVTDSSGSPATMKK